MFFSIIIPTYNRVDFISRALHSLRMQSFQDFEVIIVDDGSTADYSPTLRAFNDLDIKYQKNNLNRGVSYTRNEAIKASQGEWLVLFDDDDELSPSYLSDVFSFITENFATSRLFFWGNVKVVTYSEAKSTTEYIDFSDRKKFGSDNYFTATTIGTSYGFIVNKTIKSECIFFDESFNRGEDTEFIIRLLKNGFIPYPIPALGVIKHNHLHSRLSSSFNFYSKDKIYERIFSLHRDFFKNNIKIYMSMLFWCTKIHYENKNTASGDLTLKTFATSLLKKNGLTLAGLKRLKSLVKTRLRLIYRKYIPTSVDF